VAPALLDAGIGELFIVNRDSARADALVDALGQPGRVHSRYWQDLNGLGVFDSSSTPPPPAATAARCSCRWASPRRARWRWT
jgi:hypothetical protein